MRSAACFTVPRIDEPLLLSDSAKATMPTFVDFVRHVALWVGRVNDRAGRAVVMATDGVVRHVASGRVIKPGQVILIVEGERTQPSVYYIVDRMELLA